MDKPDYDLAATRLLLLDATVAYDFMSFDWYSSVPSSEDNRLLQFLGLSVTKDGWKNLQNALMRAGLKQTGRGPYGVDYHEHVDEMIRRNQEWRNNETKVQTGR